MKPTAKHPPDRAPLLAFGAHPDDVEFGCGGIVAKEVLGGRPAHLVVCSRGESGTSGTPAVRTAEARRAAGVLGATVEFVRLDGDARLEVKAAHALRLASIIRRVRPGFVLAPTIEENQHPDHSRLGRLVRDAVRLARYGGVPELRRLKPHAAGALLFYAVGPGCEPPGIPPLLVDISAAEVFRSWKLSMEAHASQMRTRRYVDLQVARARVLGIAAGADYAQALYPSDALVLGSLALLARPARRQ
jgi:LmbE family N-acetylglucosaminyl deacetylase